MKKLGIVALVALTGLVQAGPEMTKKELLDRMMVLQQPAVEFAAKTLAERPALQMLRQAAAALQAQVPPEQREAVALEIQSSVRLYVDDAVPLVRDRAVRLAPLIIGPLLSDQFNEDELRQLIAIMESPVNLKYSQMGGEMHSALMARLVEEMQGTIEPKVKSLEQSILKSLGLQPVSAPVVPAPVVRKTKGK